LPTLKLHTLQHDKMSEFRCSKCHNLLFKYRLVGDRVEIQSKCFKDNTFNTFTVYLPINKDIKNNEKNNKQKSEWTSVP